MAPVHRKFIVMASLPEFVKTSKIKGLEIEFTINYRHPDWLKLCFDAWKTALYENWHHPFFWVIVTPRYLWRLLWLAIKNPN